MDKVRYHFILVKPETVLKWISPVSYGIEDEIKISANAPNMNALSERFIGSVRREAFDHSL